MSREDGEKRVATFKDSDKYLYRQADISDQESVESALQSALAEVPQGSLFGLVHCAGINPNRPWVTKMTDKLQVSHSAVQMGEPS